MRAGLLKEIITILEPNTVKCEYGGTEIEYIELITTRAQVIYDKGDRSVINNEILNTYGYTFIIRAYHPLNEKMLIEWKGKKYRILSIDKTNPSSTKINTELVNE